MAGKIQLDLGSADGQIGMGNAAGFDVFILRKSGRIVRKRADPGSGKRCVQNALIDGMLQRIGIVQNRDPGGKVEANFLDGEFEENRFQDLADIGFI